MALPAPGSPTTAVTRPAATAAAASSVAARQLADTHGSPASGARWLPMTWKTSPRGAGRTVRPPARTSMSALVAFAAVCASPRSSPEELLDQVVRLMLPASSPVTGSITGAAAQV